MIQNFKPVPLLCSLIFQADFFLLIDNNGPQIQ